MNNNSGSDGEIRLEDGTVVHKASHDSRKDARGTDIAIWALAAFGFLVFSLLLFAVAFSMSGNDDGGAVYGLIPLIALLLVLGSIWYEPVKIAVDGQTFGKRRAGIKVVSFKDGSLPSKWAAFVRWALPTGLGTCLTAVLFATGIGTSDLAATPVLVLVAMVPTVFSLSLMIGTPVAWVLMYMPSLYDKNGRGVHDRIAGTIVIKAELTPSNNDRQGAMR